MLARFKKCESIVFTPQQKVSCCMIHVCIEVFLFVAALAWADKVCHIILALAWDIVRDYQHIN